MAVAKKNECGDRKERMNKSDRIARRTKGRFTGLGVKRRGGGCGRSPGSLRQSGCGQPTGLGAVPPLCSLQVSHVFFPRWKSCGKRLSRGREGRNLATHSHS